MAVISNARVSEPASAQERPVRRMQNRKRRDKHWATGPDARMQVREMPPSVQILISVLIAVLFHEVLRKFSGARSG